MKALISYTYAKIGFLTTQLIFYHQRPKHSESSDVAVVFPPAPKKGMVRFSKKGTFNARRHAMRALLSARRHAKRALKMNLFIYLQSKSLIVITVLFMLPADL